MKMLIEIGELQVQLKNNGWKPNSDAAALLSNLGITEEFHYTFKWAPGFQVKVGFIGPGLCR